ncbi:MAG: efflux RND transporter permease subunit [Ignavibacteriales bacterium]|nr:efflux RND transporter permease subunit [Ignavibacteriales bacterium]
MSLSAVSIRRPVLAIVMSITIVLFGVIGFTFLGVREYPSVDPAVVTVVASYTGANAEVMESQITEPLEEAISGIEGIRTLKSTSTEGRSIITVEFELGIDMEAAANDVRDKVSRALRLLPPDADNPVVLKADADAIPIVFLNIKSDKRDLLQLTDIAQTVFKERVQTIPGVSEVQIWGSKIYAMRLWMDPAKLSAYRLSPLDVRNALLRENIELPSGRIEGMTTELTVRTMSRLRTVDDFNDLIIRETDGRVIRFRDVGKAELGPENLRTVLKRDGIPMVGVVLVPRSGANYIAIVNEFNRRVEEIKRELPHDVELGLGFDTSKYIRESITEVAQTVGLAFLLVFLVIYVFLRDLRTTVIPMIAVPVSLIGSFFIMYLADFSINVLTLLGIVLAIGLVVDDAIVMLENIFSKIEGGMPPREAGVRGSAEVYFAVISTTVALAAVFMPVIFLQGLTGRLFREFGIVLAGSVVISSFVALSLTPMMSTRILRAHAKHSPFYVRSEPFFRNLTGTYRRSLESFMKRRTLAFLVLGLSLLAIVGFGFLLPSELAPLEDRSGVRIIATGPEGATFEFMESYMSGLIDAVKQSVPERDAIISVTSPGFGAGAVNSGFMFVILKNPFERERPQQQIAAQLSGITRMLTGARAFVTQDQSIGTRSFGLPVQFVLQAPNFEKLRETLPRFLAAAQQNPVFQFTDVNLKFNKPELRVEINRDRARALGVAAVDIAQTLQLAFSGQRFDYFIMNGKQYQVIGQVDRENRNKPLDLKSIYVRNTRSELVQLDNLVTLTEESSPPSLYRFNRYVSATVSAGLAPGYTLGDGIAAMREIADRVLDDTFSTALDGASKDYEESSSSLAFAFVLALMLIYLVLAAQFESFRDPFVIMLTVPMALAGALFSLWYFSQTINIFSQIGQIMLIGLVTKNGILIVEFGNQRKAQGLSVLEAIQDAAVARFRPILMTSLSTILGTLPIALALGAGSESRVSMGIAVIGGLVVASILTLYVIPAMYSFISKEGTSVSNVDDVIGVKVGKPEPEYEEIAK